MLRMAERQADTMAACLLMPRCIVENALEKYTQSNPIKIYGNKTVSTRDKAFICRMAAYVGVSYTAFYYRLREYLFAHSNEGLYLMNGNRMVIKRKCLEEHFDKMKDM